MSDWPTMSCVLLRDDERTSVTIVGTEEELSAIRAAMKAQHPINVSARNIQFHDGKRYRPIVEFGS